MIIEFTGCTASGKSTLASEVIKKLASRGQEAISSGDFLAGRLGFKPLKNMTVYNILLDFMLFPFSVFYFKKTFWARLFLLKRLFRKPYSFLGAVNRWRSVVRKLVVNEILCKKKNDYPLLIVDEGSIHIIHNVFVYSHVPVDSEEIRAFLGLISLPDILVCVAAPQDVILDRMASRMERRQVFDPKSKKEEYVRRACMIFDELCKVDEIEKKVIVVNTGDHRTIHKQTEDVVEFILKNIETQKS